MKRLGAALKWELVLQYRNGFYYAVAFVLAAWLAIYTQVKQLDLRDLLAGLAVGNLEITTFYFLAGLVMLEKAEGSLEARVVTPLRWKEYLLAKVLSLVLLSLIENLLVLSLYAWFNFTPLPVVLGLTLGGAVFALVGFLTVVRYDSINEYLMPSVLFTLLLMLPLLGFFRLVPGEWFYWHPIQAVLVLVQAGFQPVQTWEWLYGIGYAGVWVIGLFHLSGRAFKRFVVAAPGVK